MNFFFLKVLNYEVDIKVNIRHSQLLLTNMIINHRINNQKFPLGN